MGHFEKFPIWKEISEKEYSKWETKRRTNLEKSCIDLLLFDTTYKKVGEKLCYLCGSKEYKYLTKIK